ncbi:hypothetical protein BEN47_07570 [Hymenobacter lapidarius]|uniref:Uncharacterized protein n=1 Tax=Hymenobacter lapidarius TaxID=1908237 RepID=A0A1G1TEG2_9BACT|nr:hypothetical protein [Hymenobacter lapidarius]OGX89248.1 hypothetical protein BEN47_07570 [Hymenobacter lapidarius]
MEFNLDDALNELVTNNKLDEAINLAEDKLSELPKTDFHKILGKDLKHLAVGLSEYLELFYKSAREQIDVKALYAEMNGFTINYDLWFVDLFAFAELGGLDDFDWLADYDVPSEKSMVINGLEELQEAYRDYLENDKGSDEALTEAFEVCELIIILRLHELFKEARKLAITQKANWGKVPLFVTAHDSGLLYEVRA